MEIIKYISGPLIGAVIGYFTNYIAVKMLFYPRKEVYLFGHVLPFTPGAIPKGRTRLASAVGHAVSDNLLTKKDIEALLLSEEVKEHVTGAVMKHFRVQIGEEIRVLSGMTNERRIRYGRPPRPLRDLSSAVSGDSLSLHLQGGAPVLARRDKL